MPVGNPEVLFGLLLINSAVQEVEEAEAGRIFTAAKSEPLSETGKK